MVQGAQRTGLLFEVAHSAFTQLLCDFVVAELLAGHLSMLPAARRSLVTIVAGDGAKV